MSVHYRSDILIERSTRIRFLKYTKSKNIFVMSIGLTDSCETTIRYRDKTKTLIIKNY